MWSPRHWVECFVHSNTTDASVSIGAPSSEGFHWMPAKRSGPLPANDLHRSPIPWPRMLIAKVAESCLRGQVVHCLSTKNVTSAGSSDTDANDPTVKPTGVVPTVVVTMATGGGMWGIDRRNAVGSTVAQVAGGVFGPMVLHIHRESVVGADQQASVDLLAALGGDVCVPSCDLSVPPDLVEYVGIGERSGAIGSHEDVYPVLDEFGDDAGVVPDA